MTYILCGRESCCDHHSVPGGMELTKLYDTLFSEHFKELCDYCGMLNHKAKGLRCERCLTKLYCGVECQVKDTYHLQKIKCEKGEKRKKKRSDDSRKEVGVKELWETRNSIRNEDGV